MRGHLALLVLLALSGIVLSACIHADCSVGVEGRVTDPQDHPLEGVKVIYRPARPVYKAITPIREATTKTDWMGRFDLKFILDCDSDTPPYTLELQKEGYKTQTLSGTDGLHLVTLEPAGPSPPAVQGRSAAPEPAPLDVCGQLTAAEAATALGGTAETSRSYPYEPYEAGEAGLECMYLITFRDGGTEYYRVRVSSPEPYEPAVAYFRRTEGKIAEPISGLGDAAYLAPANGRFAWIVHVFKRDGTQFHVSGQEREGVLKLAERVLARL